MDAAECLSNLYTEVNSLIQDGQLDTPWTPLFDISEKLHELLLCHQCEHLITDPYEIIRAKCRHLVCEDCINAFSGCKPCSTKKRRVVESKELKLVVSGYRSLCKYIKTNAFFRDSVDRDCTEEKLLFISRVVEGAIDLQTQCTTSLSNGLIENINNNAEVHQSEPPLQCQEEKDEIQCSGQENECVTVSEDLADSRSNGFVTTLVTPKECVTLQEAVTPQEVVSKTDFDSSKEMETADWLVCAGSLKNTVDLISPIEVMNQEESVASEESTLIDELMSSDEVICSEELNDGNSEDLLSSKEGMNSNDEVVSSNEVLKMEVVSLKELSTSNMPLVTSKEVSVLDDASLKGSLSSNENIVEGLMSSNEAVTTNQLVPSEELYPSKDYEAMKILMSTEDPSSLSDSEAMEMSVSSEELNYSKGEGIDEKLMSTITLKGFNDGETKAELVINDIIPSNSLEVMDMTVFSEKLNTSNDIANEKVSILTTKLDVFSNDNLKMLEANVLEDIMTKEELLSSNGVNVFNDTETPEELESSKNSNDSIDTEGQYTKESRAFNNEKVTEESTSFKELNDLNEFMPKGLFFSSKELNVFKEVESVEGFVSSKQLNNSIGSTNMVELMPSKNLTLFNDDELMEGLMFLKDTEGDSIDTSKKESSPKALNLFDKDTIGEFESSKELKDPGDSITQETSKELNAFNDVVILEGLLSKESNNSNEMLKPVSSKDINTCNDEGNVRDYPTELNSLSEVSCSVPCSSLKELSKQSNYLNDGMSSVETVAGDELLSLNSSDISVESGATGQNFNFEKEKTFERLYFSSGPSTSSSVKRKLEDLCEKPIDNSIGSSINETFISRSSSPEIECTFSTLDIKNLDHCGCNSAEKQLGQSSCRGISCPCYLNDRACGDHCFCIDCRNPIDPANAKLKKFIMQNVYRRYGLLTSGVNLQVEQQCDKTNNIKTSETLRRKNYINIKNTIEAVQLNVGKFRQKPPVINCNPSSNNPELFDFSRANIQRLLFKGYGANGDKPGFVLNHSPSGKIVREPNRELWRRIDLINRKAIEQAAVNPALIAYYIDLNSQSASGPSHQNVIKRV